jgi:hypothetical protein
VTGPFDNLYADKSGSSGTYFTDTLAIGGAELTAMIVRLPYRFPNMIGTSL